MTTQQLRVNIDEDLVKEFKIYAIKHDLQYRILLEKILRYGLDHIDDINF